MKIATKIREKLTTALAPTQLTITDDSHRHQGHGGHHPDGESHFTVELVSARFTGMSRVARQRLVYDILADEMKERVHALALRTLAPGEPGA